MGLTESEAEADLATYIPSAEWWSPAISLPWPSFLLAVNGAITGQAITVDGGAYRGINY